MWQNEQDRLLRVLTGQENIFFPSASLLCPRSFQRDVFNDQDWLLRVMTGQENIFFPFNKSVLFCSQSFKRDVFNDQDWQNSTWLKQVSWRRRPPEKGEPTICCYHHIIFVLQNLLGQTCRAVAEVSKFTWKRRTCKLSSFTPGVNIYKKNCQYPGSETVCHENARQMDFYSPLPPPG